MYCNLKQANQSKISRTTAAFSLVEVMVSALLAAILFTAVFFGISNCFALLNTSRESLRATQIVVSRLEGLHLEAWGNDTNQVAQLFNPAFVPPTFTDYFYPLGLNGNTNNLGTVYTGTLNITTNIILSPPASYSGSMARVTVTVNWTNSAHGVVNQHTCAMSTYISKYGIQNYVYTH